MKRISIIIIALVICISLCACNNTEDIITEKESETTAVNSVVETEIESDSAEGEIAYPSYSSVEDMLNALYSGEEYGYLPPPYINESGVETIYEPAVEIPGFEFLNVQILPNYIRYYYVPIGETERYDFRTGILATYLRDDNENHSVSALDTIAGQLGLEYTEEGFLYDQRANAIYFPAGVTRMDIHFPDDMNDYDILKEYCYAREVDQSSIMCQGDGSVDTE